MEALEHVRNLRAPLIVIAISLTLMVWAFVVAKP